MSLSSLPAASGWSSSADSGTLSAGGALGVPPARAVSRQRPGQASARRWHTWRTLTLTGLAWAACATLRCHAEAVRELARAGNVLSTNSLSQLGPIQVNALLGHAQLLLLGAGMLLLIQWTQRWPKAGSAPLRRAAALAPLGLVLGAALAFGACAVWQQSTVVDGQRYFYLKDDAMTSMVYARHLVAGDGLVYNIGERVEGYSNLLWVLWMAFIHALGAGVRWAPFWVLASASVCVAANVYFVFDLLRALRLRAGWAGCAALGVACDQNTWTWAASGLETSALAAAVSAAVWSLVRRKPAALAAVLPLITLLRSDGFLLSAALGAISFWHFGGRLTLWRSWALAVRPLAPAALLTLALFAFRLAYYGYPFPNTYYLKMIASGDRLRTGLGGYGLRLADAYPLLLALTAALAFTRRGPPLLRALALLALLQACYAIYLGGDIFRYLRFVTPVLPLLYVASVVSLERLLAKPAWRTAPFGQALVLAACPVPCDGGQLGGLLDESGLFEADLSLARLLVQNVRPAALVTLYPAGTNPLLCARVSLPRRVRQDRCAHCAHVRIRGHGDRSQQERLRLRVRPAEARRRDRDLVV